MISVSALEYIKSCRRISRIMKPRSIVIGRDCKKFVETNEWGMHGIRYDNDGNLCLASVFDE